MAREGLGVSARAFDWGDTWETVDDAWGDDYNGSVTGGCHAYMWKMQKNESRY